MHACVLARAYTSRHAFGDQSAISCAPSHRSGQVVVPPDIVVRARREDDCVPQEKPPKNQAPN
jgi:hypothetical protein